MTVCDRCQARGTVALGEHTRIDLIQADRRDENVFIDLCIVCRDEVWGIVKAFKRPLPEPPQEKEL